ncbi:MULTISPECIES: hypothetical protein [unclassified Curtobacterium]|uniref:hypothetical protein n=1 Tax=unclassified Curtobacterium TaxID=257496 RepID=UPI000F494FCD|nr:MULTISPECIES: hypothetical protein [unclassified Curtobacterium]ROQ06152.1 hypothetical protein EDF41_2966 [Curtobacterium sp. PhB171]ROQ22701.1 hypothetical protein EDF40_2706 [Curtobacterium sp. PhB170]ROS34347.1 hypothetical protein EDF25_2789 [Curtobacterium sp. PhB131]ROS74287.1 hypothetical protein EDF30_0059 [Curtobacterium sp. PhB141]
MSDEALSRVLTDRIRTVPGVTGVYPRRPIVHAAAEAVASTLSLQEPDVLVDVQRDGAALRVGAGIAVDDTRPATDTIREVAERIRDLVDERTGAPADVVEVTIRLVEGIGLAADAPSGTGAGEHASTG